MAKPQERATSNLNEGFCQQAVEPNWWTPSLKWVLDFFSLCLPPALAFLKPHVFMYVHVLKDDLGQFLEACKRVLSLAVWFPQPSMLQLNLHNISCVSLSSTLSWNLIYAVLVSVPHTQRQKQEALGLNFKGMRYFCFLSVDAGVLQQLSLFSLYLPYSYTCIWEREGVHATESLYHAESPSLCCITQSCCWQETSFFPSFAAPRYMAPFSVVSNLSTIHIDWSRTFVLNGRLKEYALTESGQRIYSGFDTELYLPRTSDKSQFQFPRAFSLWKAVELN